VPFRRYLRKSWFNQSILLARKSYNPVLTKDFKDFQRLSSLFHTIQRLFKDLKDLHSNLKTFKDFKDRYEPCKNSAILLKYSSTKYYSVSRKYRNKRHVDFCFLTLTVVNFQKNKVYITWRFRLLVSSFKKIWQ
jgi:hypothetical protein